jgi:nucleotide-binding universal stress UspA family protein
VASMAFDDGYGSVRTVAAMDRPEAAASVRDVTGAGFPFRDFLVARTYEPRADAAATLVARALADRMRGVVVIRAEGESLERQARHAALVVVGSPLRRRPAGMPGGNASLLVRRLRIPVVAVPRQVSVDLTGLRSVVCGVRDLHDTASVAAAGALADALDLQLVLVHVWDEPAANAPGRPLVFPPGTFDAAPPGDQAAVRALLGDVAWRAGRWAPGASCLRVIDGAVGETLCRAGVDERAALVAVTASRRGPFASALFGSVARHVTRHADRPVLVCPRQPDPALRLDAHRS